MLFDVQVGSVHNDSLRLLDLNIFLVSRTITMTLALLHFQGLVDVAKEITKLESKKEKLNGQLGKLREAMEMADYVTKVHFQRENCICC